LNFQIEDRKKGRRTDLWRVWSLQEAIYLGEVSWFAHWRRYTFRPVADTVFDAGCLREVAIFCDFETRRHVVGRRSVGD
jgi:hypothetical protein